jgi:type I restriction-modification system DNA methylase subunit
MKRVKEFHIKQTELPIEELNKVYETKGVFSDHYIKTKLKTSRLGPTENEVKPFFDYCVELWDKMSTALGKRDEEFTEQELLEKILPKLGFAHLRKQSLPTTEGRKEPDYLLFDSEQVKDSVITRSKAEQYAVAISVLEAKKVNHRLDAVSKKETPGRFPHQQIRDYLQEATDNQGKPYFNWAILTNGNMWRLYCRNARPSDYFEFYFEKSLDSLENFIIFATLFRSQSFVKNNEGRCFLDDLRDEALQFQTKLEDDLRKRVFNILENLANGFYKRPENKITKDNLNELYQNCLIFLYRLLFILYAEGRGLLPVKPYGVGSNKNYRERYSLQRLIPRLKNYQEYTSEELIDLYEEILRLFHLINGDKSSVNQECNVPLYNGRLFDTDKFPKIDQWRIGEKTLGDVIRGLIFTPVPERTEEQKTFSFGDTIDYADLEVRQLGSIYEGLLENHLEIKDSGLKLVGDKAERKATGTYYTPDYIVQYIVENTIGPLCDEIEKIPVIQKAIVESRKDDSFAKTVLKLNILDPAMGSGHFLVRVTEYLADKILSHPTTYLHIEEISPGLSHERAEIAYWRRRVVESCIYGVDLNSLAVELAKLSLWLTCISPDKPLSFLDHHLRIGNSLIGAVLSELSDLPSKKKTSQLPLLFGPDLPIAIREAIRGIHNIEETESKDIAIIKDKESKWYNEVIPQLEPYRTIADLWTSTYFGSAINKNEYLQISKLLLSKPAPKIKQVKELREYLLKYKDAIEIAKVKKFFHWELQFPEVFFNENGSFKINPGFDAVIGNPPYGATLDNYDRTYLTSTLKTASGYKNTALQFIERSHSLLSKTGRCGLIVPKSLTYSEGWHRGVELILPNLIYLVDASKAFEDVLLEQIVIVFSRVSKNFDYYESAYFLASDRSRYIKIPKATYRKSQTLITSISPIEFEIYEKMNAQKFYFRNITKTFRGLPWQKYINSSGKIRILRGDHIERFRIIDKFDHIDLPQDSISKNKIDDLKQPKIISQNIVAHVIKPTPHIIIMSAFDYNGLLNLDTVNNTILTDENYKPGYLLCILNCRLTAWYTYRFIYNQAVRTMHFDEYYVGRIPVPLIKQTKNNAVINESVKKLIEIYRRDILSLNGGRNDE